MPTPQEELITQKYSAWWAALGYYTINQGGAGSGAVVAPTAVTITGDTSAATNTDVTLTANVDPGNVSLPLTYTWSVDGGTITSGAGTAVIEVQWSTSGSKSVSVQVSNAAGTVNDNHTVSVSAPSPLLTDLVAYWKLDDLTWPDSVGSNNLTNNGGVTVGPPKLGAGSAEFVAGAGQALTSTSPDLQFGLSSFSISLWLIRDVSLAGIVSTANNLNQKGFSLYFNLATLFSQVDDGSTQVDTGPGILLPASAWKHIVCTVDRSTNVMNIYVDGNSTPAGTANISGVGNIATSFFGIGNTGNLGRDYQGNIDEIGVWGRALTLGEISDLYNSGPGLSHPFN